MRPSTAHWIELAGRRVEYRIVRSRRARKLWLRVGPNGVVVTQPAGCTAKSVTAFLDTNATWILKQLQRVERLLGACTRQQRWVDGILFRGAPTRVRVQSRPARARQNIVQSVNGEILLCSADLSQTSIGRTLENWLRRQARMEIQKELVSVCESLQQKPGRLYVRDQRTRWGSCSSRKNLSFNWRLVLAPDFVLRYIVAHEVTHLAVPNHSAQFWLMVKGLCPETERAKHWLRAHASELLVDLDSVCAAAHEQVQAHA